VSGLGGQAVLFALVGAAAASVNSASGRLVMGWFGAHQRGLAMGIRQTGQPLGIALAGALLPPLAGLGGLRLALAVPATICLVVTAAVVLFAADPPHPRVAEQTRPWSPYRALILWRLHAASSLLVVPQFATMAFSAEYLVSERGWDATTAGQLLAVVAVGGAAGRMAAGRWSDIAGSRLSPMRVIALMAFVSMLLLALTASTGASLVVLALAVASIVSVSDNGLGFTATAELAGRAWSGRALGVQNTMQNVAAGVRGGGHIPCPGSLADTGRRGATCTLISRLSLGLHRAQPAPRSDSLSPAGPSTVMWAELAGSRSRTSSSGVHQLGTRTNTRRHPSPASAHHSSGRLIEGPVIWLLEAHRTTSGTAQSADEAESANHRNGNGLRVRDGRGPRLGLALTRSSFGDP